MLLALVAIVVGLVALTRGADAFVAGAARLAVALSVPAVVVGAVVVGFGTSAPEMVVSAVASGQGKLEIAAGNIIGSNVANLTLVLGVAALICSIRVDSRVLRREAPLSVGAVGLFGLLVQDGLTRWEGAVLATCLVAALGLIVRSSGGGNVELEAEVDEYVGSGAVDTRREAVRTLIGLVGVVAGAQLAVWGATGVADELGLAEGFVGLTLIAIGTSLPELVTAIAAARQGEDELIVGNLLGSNIFNSLAVGATAGIVGPGSIDDPALTGFAVVLMVAIAAAAWLFMATGRVVVRWEAILLLVAYAVSIPFLGAA